MEIALKCKIKQSKNATATKLYLHTTELLRIPNVNKVHSLLMFLKFMLHSLLGCFQPIDKVLAGKLYPATLHPTVPSFSMGPKIYARCFGIWPTTVSFLSVSSTLVFTTKALSLGLWGLPGSKKHKNSSPALYLCSYT